MKVIGNEIRQETGRWLNNRAENSHQPFRRRKRAMAKFRSVESLQKFTSIHASVHNHFNQERYLYNRQDFRFNRAASLAEWRQLAAWD
jgi:putative transposase